MAEQSFTVAATVTYRRPGAECAPGMMPTPVMMEMVLRLDPVGRRLIIGAPGVARVVRLRPSTGTASRPRHPS